MPTRMLGSGVAPTHIGNYNLGYERSRYYCPHGWQESPMRPGYIEIWQWVESSEPTHEADCASTIMYGGKLSHVVRKK